MLQLNSIGLENHYSFYQVYDFVLLLFYFDFKVYLVDLILLCNFLSSYLLFPVSSNSTIFF